MQGARWVIVFGLVTGCSTGSQDASSIVGTDISAAKGGNVDLDSRAIWTFASVLSDNVTAALLVGDGRGTTGEPSLVPGESSYQGDVCGVRARIFNGANSNLGGDAVFDPDSYQPGACPRRVLRADLGAGPVTVAPFMNARFIWHMAENTQKVETLVLDGLGVSTPCGNATNSRLEYSAGNGSGVQITRLANENGVGVWIVETTGNHLAACIKWSKGGPVDSGLDVYLPFRARIVEIPAPPGGW